MSDKYTGTHKFGYGEHCLLCEAHRYDVEDCIVAKDCPRLTDENRDMDPFVLEVQLRR